MNFQKLLPAVMVIFSILAGQAKVNAEDKVKTKLEQIVVPRIEFNDTPFSDAITFLRAKSTELDPAKEGINFVVLEPSLRSKEITMRLKKIPLGEAVRYAALLAGGEISTSSHAVTITGPTGKTKQYVKHNTDALKAKLSKTIIPSVEFADTPLLDALRFLVSKSAELDPAKEGINMIYHGDPDATGETGVTLKLSNIPLSEVLKYTVLLGAHKMKLETHSIVVKPLK